MEENGILIWTVQQATEYSIHSPTITRQPDGSWQIAAKKGKNECQYT